MADETEEYKVDPSQPSSDYMAMIGHWVLVNDILCGAEAMRCGTGGHSHGRRSIAAAMDYNTQAGPKEPYANLVELKRGQGGSESPYLPRFPNENWVDYECRRRWAPFTNIYSDISRFLASKPFTKQTSLAEGTSQDLLDLQEDIDGQGNHLNVFAHATFKGGLDKGVHYILVDYTAIPPGLSLSEEKALGARPYLVSLPAERVLAGYSVFINGAEVIVHVRIDEEAVEQAGYSEACVQRVREFYRDPIQNELGMVIDYAPAAWRLWQLVAGDKEKKEDDKWQIVGEGNVSIGIIPLVRFYTGQHDKWKVDPPLRDIALMQVEYFQQESNLKAIKELTAFPMLAGNGVDPPVDANGAMVTVPVGPRAVLFAPPGGDGSSGKWEIVETNAASMSFLQQSMGKYGDEMRNLGMQPLSVSNQTIVNTANLSIKAHSQIQALAMMLEDALELAMHYVCMWLGRPDEFPDVKIFTDFGVDMTAQLELPMLLQAQAQRILSVRTVQDELKRRGVLSDDFNPEDEEQKLAEDTALLEPDQPIDPITGKAIQNATASMSRETTSAVARSGKPNNTPNGN